MPSHSAHSDQCSFISSQPPSAEPLGRAIRRHWTVENQLAWTMDIAFNEDRSRAREKNAQANLGFLRRTALSLIENTDKLEGGVRNRRKRANWNTTILECILFAGKMAEV